MAVPDTIVRSSNWIEAGPLTIRTAREPDGLYILELYGEFDLGEADLVAHELQRAMDIGANEIFVDLSGLEFIDSAGIHVLCNAYRNDAGGDRLRFLHGHGQVRRMLEITKTDALLPLAD